MNFKESLDKYLTNQPQDGFDLWSEDVVGHYITDAFFDAYEAWLNDWDGTCNKWLNKLYDKGVSPKNAAGIIERAFKIYKPIL